MMKFTQNDKGQCDIINDQHVYSNEVQTPYTFIPMEYQKYPSLMIHLKQILHSRKTKAEIDTGNTIEYDVTSYQVK